MIGIIIQFILCQAMLEPEVISLETSKIVRDVVFEDFNSDGRKDVLLLTTSLDNHHKEIVVYFQRTTKPTFTTDYLSRLELVTPFSIVFIARGAGNGTGIVIGNSEGLYVYSWDGTKFEMTKEIKVSTIFPFESKEPMVLRDLACDLDEDGIDEWFIPTSKGIKIFQRSEMVSEVDFRVLHEVLIGNNLNLLYQFPVIYPFAMDNTSSKAVSFFGDMELVIAYGDHWRSVRKFRFDRRNLEKWDFSSRIGDINGDSFPDVLITETQGTINLRTNVLLYVSQGPFEYQEKHNYEFNVKGAVCIPVMKDVNKDKVDDLILFSIPLGLTNFINFFVRGKLSVDAKVFISKDGRLSTEPDFKTSLTMDAPEGRDQVAYALDDFSGDGVLDIAFGQSKKVIAINCGSIEGFLKTKPWLKLELPGFGIIRTGKINQNDRADMVIFRPTGEFKNQVDIILF